MKIVFYRHGETAGNLKKRYIGRTDEPLCEEGIKNTARCPLPPEQIRLLAVSPMLRCMQTAAVLFGAEPENLSKNIRDRASFLRFMGKHSESSDGKQISDSRDGSIVASAAGKSRFETVISEDLRECDFGLFENRNYLELSGEPLYQAWVDSGGTAEFPGGEAPDLFQERCCRAFEEVMAMLPEETEEANQMGRGACDSEPYVVFVVHGGTIMSIMDRYGFDVNGKRLSYFDWHIGNGECLTARYKSSRSGRILLEVNEEEQDLYV